MSRLSFTSLATLASVAAATDHVAVSKNGFAYKGDPVFLSGVNQAWISYGNDFGNDQGKISFCPLNSTLEQMKLNGGHVNRIWLHVEGDNV
jgi:mannan endo-1,4-beta-mannosidase